MKGMKGAVIRRIIVTAILILFCFVAQTSVFAVIPVTGATPDLMMILTASMGLLRGDVTGLIVGFFSGFVTDIFYGDIIGFHALIYMYAGFVCGRFHKKYYPENFLLPLTVITVADLGAGVVRYVLLYVTRLKLNVIFYALSVVIPEAVFTLIVALLLYPMILKVNAFLEDAEQRSARKFV